MEYRVTDLDMRMGEHDIVIRGLECDSQDHDDLAYVGCRSCYKMTRYSTRGKMTDDHLRLMYMEAGLHAEGFDTEWQPGELQDLG